jgi:putative methionine-R-sulfoxide reductase with GAF domain
VSTRTLEALDRILNRGGDADEVVRAVVRLLIGEPTIRWAGIRFLEGDTLVLGPEAGEPDESRRVQTPIVYRSDVVGELVTDGEAEAAFLARVATLISAHVLLAWDTRGETWEP